MSSVINSGLQYAAITEKCFINAPFSQLRDGDLLELFIANRLHPEIGLEGNMLWELDRDEFQNLAAILQEHDLSCTLHAPFSDLSPGGFDQKIVEVTREKLARAFGLLPIFKPRSIVCHLGFEENKHAAKFNRWLETALETWRPLLETAKRYNTRVMFENTYETKADVHKILFEKLNAPHLGFCMDTGHLTAFAHSDWQPWLQELLPWLGQLHLHDNNGTADSHLAPGQGVFDFHKLFEFLRNNQKKPLLTLEPHTLESLWLSLAFIKKTKIF